MRVKYSDGGIIYVKDVITAEADPKEKEVHIYTYGDYYKIDVKCKTIAACTEIINDLYYNERVDLATNSDINVSLDSEYNEMSDEDLIDFMEKFGLIDTDDEPDDLGFDE